MNFDPQKFFIGLMDFFTVLLPGALLAFLIQNYANLHALDKFTNLSGPAGWVAFFFASYLLGHLLFVFSTQLDELYDLIRGYTLGRQIKLMAHKGRLLNWLARYAINSIFKAERNVAVDRAGRIKARSLTPLQAKGAINTFQWAKAYLHKKHPESLSTVQNFEAASKFFRSFFLVAFGLECCWIYQSWIDVSWNVDQGWLTIAGLILVLASLSRYMSLRFKATNQAYWSVITLTGIDGETNLRAAGKHKDAKGFTHAGGIVFRKKWCWWGETRYLLVTASSDPEKWVLPKGHIEAGEDPRETAVREVHEETGMWAEIKDELGEDSFSRNGEKVTVKYYLMQWKGTDLPLEKFRQAEWVSLEKVEGLPKGLREFLPIELLDAAEKMRKQIESEERRSWLKFWRGK